MQGKQLLKRKEIIEIWQAQSEEFLNSYCCPDCRNIMDSDEENYFCCNEMCENMTDYKKSDVEKSAVDNGN